MFALETLTLVNRVAHELALQGRPEREALTLVTDPRKSAELNAVLESADRRNQPCCCCPAYRCVA